MGPPALIGREAELARIASFLDARAYPSALLLEGEPGIGKTTLWRAGVELARERGYLVLSCAPTSDEAQLAFSSLADLLAPTLEPHLAQLPEPQRTALEIALLLRASEGVDADGRAVAAAVTSLLRLAGGNGPVLVACDDVQWLDGPSAAMVSFALRRLRPDDRALVLVARRTTDDAVEGPVEHALPQESLTRLPVRPLSLGALARLLGERLGFRPARGVLLRIHETSGGNPFYALELARALRERDHVPLRGHLPVPKTLEGLLSERFADLPPPSIRALQAAALLSEPTVALVTAATGRSAERALAPAESAGLVERDGERVRFAHPLLAAAVVSPLAAEASRALHRRLARAVETLEERAHHLALGLERPSEEAAATIEAAAEELAARGAVRVAAELMDDAVRLTPSRSVEARCRRLRRAGWLWHRALDWPRARERAEHVLRTAWSQGDRWDALLLLATCSPSPREHVDLLLAESDDAALRARALLILADHQLDEAPEDGLASVSAAVSEAERSGDAALLAQSLAQLGMIESVRGDAAALGHLERGAAIERGGVGVDLASSPSLALGEHLLIRDDVDGARALLEAALERANAAGDEAVRAHVLWVLAYVEHKAGRWDLADRYAEASVALQRVAGNQGEAIAALALRAIQAAARGDAELVASIGDEVREIARVSGMVERAARQEAIALQLLELGRGRYEDAARHGGSTSLASGPFAEPGLLPGVPSTIEALIGAGRLDEADGLLAEWEELGRRLDRPRALATGARCRGLLLAARGDQEAALESLERALVEHDRLPVPFERGRTLLALGAQRRRCKRRAEARAALEEALAIFEELGAAPWAERARRELARIPGRRAAHSDELTESERRIAELVAEGRSNKEVAGALHVSVKTVELTLTRVYRKLGVRSRSELTRVLAAPAKD